MRHLNHTALRRRGGIVGWFALGLAVIVAAALAALWLLLADYQQSLPKNLADRVLAAYQHGDARLIGEYCFNLPEPMEDPALFADYYAANTDLGALYYYPGASGSPDRLCYEFAAQNSQIATLTLQETGGKSRFGFPLYEIEALRGYPLTSYQISAPGDAVLFVNGRLLGDRYCTGKQLKTDAFYALTGEVYWTKTYETSDFVYLSELDAVSEPGCTVAWSEDGRSAVVEKKPSEEQQEQIRDFAIKFAQAYSVFAAKQYGPRAPAQQLVHPGTALYKALSLYNNDWGESYLSDRYENRVIDGFACYSPTEFSCNIRFDYVIRFADGFEKTYPYNMTYYLTNRNGRLQLVDMQTRLP